MFIRLVLRLAAALVIAITCSVVPAEAHAVLVEALPAPNATVSGPAFDIRLRFNSRLDHVRSSITLIAADGRADRVAMVEDAPPDALVAHVASLAPGHYRLRWQVLAVDGHITRGDVEFTVSSP